MHSECVEAFRILDLDNDGKVAVYELGLVMRAVGMNPTDVQLQQMVKEVDRNGKLEKLYTYNHAKYFSNHVTIYKVGI